MKYHGIERVEYHHISSCPGNGEKTVKPNIEVDCVAAGRCNLVNLYRCVIKEITN